jgi:hypothetical protein
VNSLRCVQVIAGVLGRAGQVGKEHRLALGKRNIITYGRAVGLETPDHLLDEGVEYPSVVRLGGTIQELEEQDRGIQYDYRLDEDLDNEVGDGLTAKADHDGDREDLRGE